MGLFGLTLFIGNYFKKVKLEGFIGAPTIGICLGIAFSAIVVYGGATESYKEVLSFEPDLFLYVLLPTIIIDASLNVNAHLLLLNLGTILVSERADACVHKLLLKALFQSGSSGAAFQTSQLIALLFPFSPCNGGLGMTDVRWQTRHHLA